MSPQPRLRPSADGGTLNIVPSEPPSLDGVLSTLATLSDAAEAAGDRVSANILLNVAALLDQLRVSGTGVLTGTQSQRVRVAG